MTIEHMIDAATAAIIIVEENRTLKKENKKLKRQLDKKTK